MTTAAIAAVSNFHEHSDPLAAWQIWRCDGDEHESPNAGQPEGAVGGALHIRLGGDNTYGGELIRAAHIGHEFSRPSLPKAKSAIRLVSVVALLGVACGVILSTCVQSREAPGSSR
jgi:adenosylcobinamide-phosphate synthase